MAQGVLDGDSVLVADTAQAHRLHNKGFVGAPTSDNGLRLSVVEAIHCIQAGRLAVDGHDAISLLRHGAADGERTEVEHLAYHDLRERGLVVRPSDGIYTVWKRGEGPKHEPWFTTRVVAERAAIDPAELTETDVVSVVDEDGGVIHYDMEALVPAGDCPLPALPRAAATLLDDRVLVSDETACARLAEAFVGAPHPAGRVLSLTEAEALRRQDALDVEPLMDHATSRQPHFRAALAAYEALRAAGVVARSGFRFGTHLRGYRTDPDTVHADWLIHCAQDSLSWPELSRGVRLAHGVRKAFLVAHGDPVQFTAATWFRP